MSPLGTSIAVAIKSDGAQTIDVWSTVGDNGSWAPLAVRHLISYLLSGPVITSNAFGTLIHRTNLPYEIYQARLVVRIVGRMSLFAPLINWPFQTLSRWVPRATLKKLRPGHKVSNLRAMKTTCINSLFCRPLAGSDCFSSLGGSSRPNLLKNYRTTT